MQTDQIICGDNVEVMQSFPDDCIDLVVTSPPYDDLRTYGGHSWDFEVVAAQLKRVIKPGGVIVWVVSDQTIDGSETGTSFRQALHFQNIGLRIHDTMIWRKVNPMPLTHNRYEQEFEFMFVFSLGRPKSWNPKKRKTIYNGAACDWSKRAVADNASRRSRSECTNVKAKAICGNVWDIVVNDNAKEGSKKHPAPFPVVLARDHILSWSNENDLVLDPFNGSGTTTKMAYQMGRRYIGIDIHGEYCEIARKRLQQKVLF